MEADMENEPAEDIFRFIDFQLVEPPLIQEMSCEVKDNELIMDGSQTEPPSVCDAYAMYRKFMEVIHRPGSTVNPSSLHLPAATLQPKRRKARTLYTCDHPACGKTFTRHFNFQQHSETHNPNRKRPFVCPITSCGKTFSRNADLKRHEVIHTKRDCWTCYCGTSFGRKDAIHRHQKFVKCKQRLGLDSSTCR